MKPIKLTPTQARALAKLTDDWNDAYGIGESIATLNAIVKKGVAEHKQDMLGAMFSPRTANHYRIRRTD